MSGRNAGLAFTTWPLFDGHVVPATHGLLPDLHFAHRVVAAMVAMAIFALARLARRRPQAPPVNRMVRAASALIGIEILIGAGNVWTKLSAVTRTAHLATGALIWAVLFTAARLAWRLPAGEPAVPTLPAGAGDGSGSTCAARPSEPPGAPDERGRPPGQVHRGGARLVPASRSAGGSWRPTSG